MATDLYTAHIKVLSRVSKSPKDYRIMPDGIKRFISSIPGADEDTVLQSLMIHPLSDINDVAPHLRRVTPGVTGEKRMSDQQSGDP